METPFKNIKLPAFSDKQNDYLYVQDLTDANCWKQELENQIIDGSKCEHKEKNYEVEHSYVDF